MTDPTTHRVAREHIADKIEDARELLRAFDRRQTLDSRECGECGGTRVVYKDDDLHRGGCLRCAQAYIDAHWRKVECGDCGESIVETGECRACADPAPGDPTCPECRARLAFGRCVECNARPIDVIRSERVAGREDR